MRQLLMAFALSIGFLAAYPAQAYVSWDQSTCQAETVSWTVAGRGSAVDRPVYSLGAKRKSIARAPVGGLCYESTRADQSGKNQWRLWRETPSSPAVGEVYCKATGVIITPPVPDPAPVTIDIEPVDARVSATAGSVTTGGLTQWTTVGDSVAALPDVKAKWFDGPLIGLPGEAPRLDVPFKSVSQSEYTVWVEISGPKTASDSVHVGLNGEVLQLAVRAPPARTWVKIDGLYDFPPGDYVINFWPREDGVVVYGIFVTATSEAP